MVDVSNPKSETPVPFKASGVITAPRPDPQKLDVDFRNYVKDRTDNPNIDPSQYLRVQRCWNIYFHGFMDEGDDIAYVLERTAIEPGIYEVDVYDIPAILYLWDTHDGHHRPLKGLIVRKGDISGMVDAQQKYDTNKAFI